MSKRKAFLAAMQNIEPRYSDFYKQNDGDKIWWIDELDSVGNYLFSFDKKIIFNLFSDYPYKLTATQKAIFDAENPYWAKFFDYRQANKNA